MNEITADELDELDVSDGAEEEELVGDGPEEFEVVDDPDLALLFDELEELPDCDELELPDEGLPLEGDPLLPED